jgi:hypothetical protein
MLMLFRQKLSLISRKDLPQYVLLSLAQGAMMGSRMRESFMSGSERGKVAMYGIRLVRHIRGNPETDYGEA